MLPAHVRGCAQGAKGPPARPSQRLLQGFLLETLTCDLWASSQRQTTPAYPIQDPTSSLRNLPVAEAIHGGHLATETLFYSVTLDKEPFCHLPCCVSAGPLSPWWGAAVLLSQGAPSL